MKALAIDSACSCITFAAVNEDKSAVISLNIGMHQSESLIPCIQQVMEKTGLTPADLEFTCMDLGPGSFTGLRLVFSALKAFELSHNIPVYGIPTLEAFAYPWSFYKESVLSVIDAKKNRFYGQIYKNGKSCTEIVDTEVENIFSLVKKNENILVCGYDAVLFENKAKLVCPDQKLTIVKGISTTTVFSLLNIAEQKYLNKENGLPEYEGPLYIRKSEAELNLKKNNSVK